MPHLLVGISGHGFGHIAQTGPVLNALRQRLPGLRLTVVSSAPEFKLRQRIDWDFELHPRAWDFGFVMEDAFRIDREASARTYQEFHADWEGRVAREADWIAARKPDLVLANAAYLPLAAAARRGIPAMGISSLNWADLFHSIFGANAWSRPIHAQMLAAYGSAQVFLKLAPGMAMPDLANGCWIGPVARLGRQRSEELRQLLKIPAGTRLVLAALGGIPTRVAVQDWPQVPELHWLVPSAWGAQRPDMTAFEPLGWEFTDLVASVEAMVGKPGYGTFAEAACNGTPMLYSRRPDWAEQDALIPWLEAYGCCREVEETRLQRGELNGALEDLWQQARPTPPTPTGAAEAAALLAAALA